MLLLFNMQVRRKIACNCTEQYYNTLTSSKTKESFNTLIIACSKFTNGTRIISWLYKATSIWLEQQHCYIQWTFWESPNIKFVLINILRISCWISMSSVRVLVIACPRYLKELTHLKAFAPQSQRWKRNSHNFWVLIRPENHAHSLFSTTSHVNSCTKLTEQMQQVRTCCICSPRWRQQHYIISIRQYIEHHTSNTAAAFWLNDFI